MINENQVVDYVCKYLEDNNYTVSQRLNTNEKGHDIVAYNVNNKKLIIEAKGGTSSKPVTNRFGKDFDRKQVIHQVAMAIYAVCKTIDSEPECEVGIALPRNEEHMMAVKKIQRAIDLLGIKIYWVSLGGKVETCLM